MAVILPDNLVQQPEPHEIEVARILSKHFRVDVAFLVPINGYKRKTPDIEMSGVQWEIKSPIGKSKKLTIERHVKDASRQSQYIIIDGRRTGLGEDLIIKTLHKEFMLRRRLKRILFVNKNNKVINIHRG